ncbi:MAG: hypothetical protein HYV04_12120 [Deltaproteobacteria bacterium]|nr:hypothetical protein [Deltaproteobacteria bacterium]
MEYTGRTLESVKAEMLNRAGRINPFEWVKKEDVSEVVERLKSLDPDHWGTEWATIGALLSRLRILSERPLSRPQYRGENELL